MEFIVLYRSGFIGGGDMNCTRQLGNIIKEAGYWSFAMHVPKALTHTPEHVDRMSAIRGTELSSRCCVPCQYPRSPAAPISATAAAPHTDGRLMHIHTPVFQLETFCASPPPLKGTGRARASLATRWGARRGWLPLAEETGQAPGES